MAVFGGMCLNSNKKIFEENDRSPFNKFLIELLRALFFTI